MPKFERTMEIDRPVEDVFAYLAEPKNTAEWESGVELQEQTSEGPMGLGATGRRVETYMGRDESVWEVTEWKPNEAAAFKFESDKFIGDGRWSTEATDGGTRLTFGFSGTPKNPFFKLIMPLMMPMVNGRVKKNFTKLKEILESQS